MIEVEEDENDILMKDMNESYLRISKQMEEKKNEIQIYDEKIIDYKRKENDNQYYQEVKEFWLQQRSRCHNEKMKKLEEYYGLKRLYYGLVREYAMKVKNELCYKIY